MELAATHRIAGPFTRRLLVEPPIPLVEIDEFVLDAIGPVLRHDFVDSPGESLRVGVRPLLVVVEEDPCVVVLPVQQFEVLCVVRQEND